MGFIKEYRFGDVQAFETGRASRGKSPLISSFSYLAGGVMIDTGPRHARKEMLQAHRLYPVKMICLTHHHEDHSGNAAAMRDLWGLQIHGHPLCVQKMAQSFPILPYQRFLFGKSEPVAMENLPERIDTRDIRLYPIYTPGHSKDHTCYFEPNRGWLFSGDAYLGDRAKYFRSDENMGEEILSLRKIMDLDFESLFCAHNPQPLNGKACIATKLAFLEDMYGKVADLRSKGMGPRGIMRKLAIKESYATKIVCMGNISALNMVRSALEVADAGGPESLAP
ncbi:MAG: MBL fold metallo-hydrolase [Desulfatibacillum sp.]|nr:MBL fold metallo-hydrolase [Desulfatibacillum sp.]